MEPYISFQWDVYHVDLTAFMALFSTSTSSLKCYIKETWHAKEKKKAHDIYIKLQTGYAHLRQEIVKIRWKRPTNAPR